MGRDVTTNLQSLLPASESQSTLVLKQTDGTIKRFATVRATDPDGNFYQSYLKKISDLYQSDDTETDRTAATIQNVDCAAGIDAVSASQKFEMALATVGRFNRSIRNLSNIEWRTMLPGMVIGLSVDEDEVQLNIVPDYEGIGYVLAARVQNDYCPLLYKGLECGSTSILTTCNHLLKSLDGCTGRANTFRNGSFKFPEQPADVPPGSPGNPGDTGSSGGSSPGGYFPPPPPCFTALTMIATPRGNVPICEIRVGDWVYAFHKRTRKIVTVQARKTFRRTVNRTLSLEFEHKTIETTFEHPFLTRIGFVPANRLKLGQMIWIIDDRKKWHLSRLKKFRTNWKQTEVFNFHSAVFNSYFADSCAVKNRCTDDDGFQIYNPFQY